MAGNRILFCLLWCPILSFSQLLHPGFSKAEYAELLRVSARQTDTAAWAKHSIEAPHDFTLAYRAPVTGLDNRWDLWMNQTHDIAAISIRGTTASGISWLENFYSAMIPAQGELHLSDTVTFKYHLADNEKAAVHIGWLIGLASMANNINSKIDSCYKAGIRNFYIMGHSQGGAIAYLLTSYLHYQQTENVVPADITFKTYCSAAPKPGNLFFAYDYETYANSGWAYNVVNSADWVPQTPVAVQTLDDFNTTNPFTDAKAIIRKQKFPKNIVLRHVFNRLYKSSRKAKRTYQKYLGSMVYKITKKNLPHGFQQPAYYNSMHFERAGNFIILNADTEYYTHYPDSKEKVFVHHGIGAYLYLLNKRKE